MKKFINDLQAQGRYSFTKKEAASKLNLSDVSLRAALRRQKAAGRITSPVSGFFVIVPTEYSLTGSPPASWLIDGLCDFLDVDYYVGLLTAASIHGASHQQAQFFQVILSHQHRPLISGRNVIHFHSRKKMKQALTEEVKTPTGYMTVSGAESTALDIVRFMNKCGGDGNAITVISEIAEKLNGKVLKKLIHLEDTPVIQRLGFLLERTGNTSLAQPLENELRKRASRRISLFPGAKPFNPHFNSDWKITHDADLEPES
jgi:predicted transcriptional regulator of viral defense system